MKAMDKKLTYGVWEYFSMILGLSKLFEITFFEMLVFREKVSNIGKDVYIYIYWKDLYNRCPV